MVQAKIPNCAVGAIPELAFARNAPPVVNEVASKTSDVVGDGTTTSTVLAEAIYNEGLRHVTAGSNPMAIQRGIGKAAEVATTYIQDVSVPVKGHDDIAKVATISANNDPSVGDILAEAIDQVGSDGVIEVEEGKGMENELNVVEGVRRVSETPILQKAWRCRSDLRVHGLIYGLKDGRLRNLGCCNGDAHFQSASVDCS